MKRNIILFVAAAVTLLLAASCNRKVEYQYDSYATLYNSSFSVAENAGELKIPVLVKNTNGDVQVSVKINEGKALEGVDYEVVSPANGILNFSGNTDSLAVVIKINSFEGEFTGAKDFSVSIASATEGVTVGQINSAAITIIDLDHPLSPYIGTWKGKMLGSFRAPSYDVTFVVSAVDGDDTFSKLVFDAGINPYFVMNGYTSAKYSATVTGEYVVIYAEQPVGYSDVVLLGFDHADPSLAASYDHLRFQLQEDGSLKQINAFGAYTAAGGGFHEIYLGGPTFTKE